MWPPSQTPFVEAARNSPAKETKQLDEPQELLVRIQQPPEASRRSQGKNETRANRDQVRHGLDNQNEISHLQSYSMPDFPLLALGAMSTPSKLFKRKEDTGERPGQVSIRC